MICTANDTVTYADGSTVKTIYTKGTVTGKSGTAVHPSSTEFGANWTKQVESNVTSYTNMLGQNYKTVLDGGATALNFYNSKGQLWKQQTPEGRITIFVYDDLGRRVKTVQDLNKNSIVDAGDIINEQVVSFATRNGKKIRKVMSYLKNGTGSKLLSIQESTLDGLESWQTANGLTTYAKTERLGGGRIKQTVIRPDNSKTVSESLNGRTVKVANTPGNILEYTYDEFNRTAKLVEKNGTKVINTTVMTYNKNSEVLTTVLNGRTTTFTYDNMGRRVKVAQPGGRIVNNTYFSTGELKTVNGSDNYKQAFAYNNLGQMQSFTTWRSDSTPQQTRMEYDKQGRLLKKIYPDNKFTLYTYNADGQIKTRKWHRGITTSYSYDNGGRQTKIDYSDTTPDVTFSYDKFGRVATVTDAVGTHTMTYNANNQLATMNVPYLNNMSLSYGYDNLLRRNKLTLTRANSTVLVNNYSFDNMSRFASIDDGTAKAAYSRVAGTGQLNQTAFTVTNNNTSSKVMTVSRSYDKHHRLTAVSSTTAASTPFTESSTYQYNDRDQRVKLTLADGSYWTYTYDDTGQLTGAFKRNSSDVLQSNGYYKYSYDLIGNRLTEKREQENNVLNFTANKLNQYTAIAQGGSSKSFTYDADGNLTNDGNFTYTWNGENRLVKVEKANNIKVEYKYDFSGRRTHKVVYNWNNSAWAKVKELRFVYDYNNLIAEYKVAGSNESLLRSYLWGEDISGSLNGAGGVGGLLMVKDNSGNYYPMYDGNGNIKCYVDGTGALQAKFDYDAFGRVTSATGAKANDLLFRFSTKYFDAETNTVHYRFRDYSPANGKWLSRDPIGEQGGVNLYQVLSNNVINNIDIYGLYKKCISVSLPIGSGSNGSISGIGYAVDWNLGASVTICASFNENGEMTSAEGSISFNAEIGVTGGFRKIFSIYNYNVSVLLGLRAFAGASLSRGVSVGVENCDISYVNASVALQLYLGLEGGALIQTWKKSQTVKDAKQYGVAAYGKISADANLNLNCDAENCLLKMSVSAGDMTGGFYLDFIFFKYNLENTWETGFKKEGSLKFASPFSLCGLGCN